MAEKGLRERLEELADAINDYGDYYGEYDRMFDGILEQAEKEKRKAVAGAMKWITDRDPTEEEVEYAGDVGFILCFTGVWGMNTYDHAIAMGENHYENGEWYIYGFKAGNENITIHGWMLPPEWTEEGKEEK